MAVEPTKITIKIFALNYPSCTNTKKRKAIPTLVEAVAGQFYLIVGGDKKITKQWMKRVHEAIPYDVATDTAAESGTGTEDEDDIDAE